MPEIGPITSQPGDFSGVGSLGGVGPTTGAGGADEMSAAVFSDKMVTMLGQQIFDLIMTDMGQ